MAAAVSAPPPLLYSPNYDQSYRYRSAPSSTCFFRVLLTATSCLRSVYNTAKGGGEQTTPSSGHELLITRMRTAAASPPASCNSSQAPDSSGITILSSTAAHTCEAAPQQPAAGASGRSREKRGRGARAAAAPQYYSEGRACLVMRLAYALESQPPSRLTPPFLSRGSDVCVVRWIW